MYLAAVMFVGVSVQLVSPAISIGMILKVLHCHAGDPAVELPHSILLHANNDSKCCKKVHRNKMVELINCIIFSDLVPEFQINDVSNNRFHGCLIAAVGRKKKMF